MRKFKVVTINQLIEGNSPTNKHLGEVISIIPILSEHYMLGEDEFRCTEHKKGGLKLINNDFLLFLKEIY